MSQVTIPPIAQPDPGAIPPTNPNPPQPNQPPADAHAATPTALAPAGDYHNGRLTRAGMESRIKAGGSILHKDRVITRVEDLPTVRQLALDHVDADRRHLGERRAAIARREADARSRGTYDLEKSDIDHERTLIDREVQRITAATSASEDDAIADVQRRRQALDAEEAQLKAAQASAPKPAKK